jgi:hypothetical protein
MVRSDDVDKVRVPGESLPYNIEVRIVTLLDSPESKLCPYAKTFSLHLAQVRGFISPGIPT